MLHSYCILRILKLIACQSPFDNNFYLLTRYSVSFCNTLNANGKLSYLINRTQNRSSSTTSYRNQSTSMPRPFPGDLRRCPQRFHPSKTYIDYTGSTSLLRSKFLLTREPMVNFTANKLSNISLISSCSKDKENRSPIFYNSRSLDFTSSKYRKMIEESAR